jgi:hypothetical protein
MLQKIYFALGMCIAFCTLTLSVNAQGIAINTDGSNADNSAMLDVQSVSAGILIPRMTEAQKNAISNPATGLMVFQTDNTVGFYYNAGSSGSPSWIKLSVPTDNFDDADSDVTNEIQSLSISGHDITLSNGGGTITVPDNVNDADAVIGNEFQSLSISGHTISLSDGGGSVTVPDNVNDADAVIGNEFQTLSISGHTVSLSDGGGSVTVPDNNTTYSAGSGLSLSGTTFTNTGDLSNTNEIQNLTSVLGQGNSAGNAQITSLDCDGGTNDAASCGWVSEENNLWVLSANMCYSPDDLWGQGGSSTGTLTGDDATYTATLPFNVIVDGTTYNTVGISTNGFIEFGGTSSSDYSNDCLPTSSHSGPFVAAYWDDLKTRGNGVRYGYVGTSPNRVYIIDFECETYSGSYDVSFQIQIHESSGMINVKYRNTMDSAANGQNATIGFQGVGGSSATAYPITCNGKVLDDNRDDSEGWSVCPLR